MVRADQAAGHANSGWTGRLAQKQETAGARRGYLKANMRRGKKKQKLIGRVKRVGGYSVGKQMKIKPVRIEKV